MAAVEVHALHHASRPDGPLDTYVSYRRILPDLVQQHVLRDCWVVAVEADSGEGCRVKAVDQAHAIEYAKRIRKGVEEHGVGFLKTFTH